MNNPNQEIVIDFSQFNKLEENEEGMNEFANDVKNILLRMYGENSAPVTIKGSQSQVDSFAKAIGAEKRYIDSAREVGVNDPRTSKERAKAEEAANEFKRETGVDWPIQ